MNGWQSIFGSSTAAHRITTVVAIVSLVVGIVSIAIALMLRQRNRRSSAYIAALERLNEVALGLASAPGEIVPLLDRLASVARELLHMPISRIAFLEADSMRAVHHFGATLTRDEPAVFKSDSARQQCLRDGRPIFINALDRSRDAIVERWLDAGKMQQQGITSLIVLPLVASKESVGLMVLARCGEGGRAISDAQRRLAELLAAHAAATIANARLYQRMDDAIRSYRRVEAQRDIVYRVNTAMQRVGSLSEALSRAAELAPSALEVEACVVCLADDAPIGASTRDVIYLDDSLRVAAVTSVRYEFPLRAGVVRRSPLFARLMRRAFPIAIADADQDVSLKSLGLTSAHGVGSVLCMPLMFRSGRPIGALLLTRRLPGKFSDDAIKFAEIFSSRAAISIENARLQEQARRDAETKAELLRELNHRVKNNLSGLIGLLSIGTPPLSAEAQRWLDRVIDRIGALARAHELFSNGKEVRLSRMIDTTLDSIAAIKPDAVRVDVAMGDHDVVLSAAQTVPAALVLYELVYNAVVHGAGEAGEIEVQVNQPAAGSIAIDVIDNGGEAADIGAGAEPIPRSSATTATRAKKPPLHRGSNIGLTLVRGLVARELHGTFEIRANQRGGMTASVVFPIDATPPIHETSS